MLGRTYAIGYEPDLDRDAARPAATDRAEPGVDVGGVVSAAPQRPVRAAAGRRTARHPGRARSHRHVIRRRRLRARHPPRVPRPRQGRQRFHRRADRQGAVSALARSCRTCGAPNRRRSTSSGSGHSSSGGRSIRARCNLDQDLRSEDLMRPQILRSSDLSRSVSRRRERRRVPMLRRLLVGVRDLDQRRLAPRATEEREPDRQAAKIPHRHRDVRIASDRGDR